MKPSDRIWAIAKRRILAIYPEARAFSVEHCDILDYLDEQHAAAAQPPEPVTPGCNTSLALEIANERLHSKLEETEKQRDLLQERIDIVIRYAMKCPLSPGSNEAILATLRGGK
jgi:hypothetical protein